MFFISAMSIQGPVPVRDIVKGMSRGRQENRSRGSLVFQANSWQV